MKTSQFCYKTRKILALIFDKGKIHKRKLQTKVRINIVAKLLNGILF